MLGCDGGERELLIRRLKMKAFGKPEGPHKEDRTVVRL